MLKLNIGCGKNILPGFSGVDILNFGQEYVLDVRDGLPFEDGCVETIVASHFIEHLDGDERIKFFNEIYRVLKPEGMAVIVAPYYSHPCAYGDPTHKFPPITEWYTHYLKAEWRDRYAPHTGYTCDFTCKNEVQTVHVNGYEIMHIATMAQKTAYVKSITEPRVITGARAFDDVKEFLRGYDVILFANAARATGENITPGSTIYNMEPLYDGCGLVNMGYLDVLRTCRVFDYQKKNVAYLKAKGINATYLQYGYHPSLTRIKPTDEDIDVLFVGGVGERRSKKLNELKSSGMNVKIITHGCYGDELDAIVARAKIVLNIHYHDAYALEVVRLNYLLANKKFVVTERGWDEEDNALYADGVVFAEYGDLVGVCREYLERNDDRARISQAGFDLVRKINVDVGVLA